jgi:hypothetical protein
MLCIAKFISQNRKTICEKKMPAMAAGIFSPINVARDRSLQLRSWKEARSLSTNRIERSRIDT